jgi:hypothetical protein
MCIQFSAFQKGWYFSEMKTAEGNTSISQDLFEFNFSLGYLLLLFFGVFGSLSPVFSQNADSISLPVDTTCIERDLSDVIRDKFNLKDQAKNEKSSSVLVFPIIGSNPATGFMFGFGGQAAFKLPESTLYSLISGSTQLTTKNQFIVMVKNNIYTRFNKLFLTGDWRFLIYSQSTYGLGTTAPESGILNYQYNFYGLETETDSLTQPMNFNFLRFHQSIGFKIKKGIYLGVGYQFDGYWNIVDQRLRLNPGDSLITSHFAYNSYYGFDKTVYNFSAFTINFVLDSRDNMVNATLGHYLNIKYNGAYQFLGNLNSSNLLNVEYRGFRGVSKRNKDHLIGVWVIGDFTPQGKLPYLVLPATAYDQRSRSARGYTQGRFRGAHMIYGEIEYRFPISPCGGVLGGVLFANGTTASNELTGLKLFQSIQPAAGFGLRIKVDKKTRTNLAVDFGFGRQSFGFYLAASETF